MPQQQLYGLGLRSKHYAHILENLPQVDFFEIISENFMNSKGRPREMLDKIRVHYPIIMHGVSLSIGSTDPINMEYLRRLKALADDIKPLWISDHLCWTGINGKNTHDLLPVPLTEESLNHIIPRIKQVQDFLGQQILIENPSSYLTYRADHIPEYEFMARLCEAADCKILLDVNNVYVASFNQRLSAEKYIDAIPANRIGQIHLAGHTHKGTHIVDTHDSHVSQAVWDLYSYTITQKGHHPTMIEWDGNIPEFDVLETELAKCKVIGNSSKVMKNNTNTYNPSPITNHSLDYLQDTLQTAILSAATNGAETWIADKPNFPPHEQIGVYITAYRLRLRDILLDDYEATLQYLGKEKFLEYARDFVNGVPSTFYDAGKYSESFVDWLQANCTDKFAIELADLERKISECYNLENSEPATQQDFKNISPEEFVNMSIVPRKSGLLLHYQNNVNQYLSDFVAGKTNPQINKLPCYLLLYRKTDKAYRLSLEKQEFEFLQNLQNGQTIGEAMEALPENFDPQHIQNWFSKWLSNSALSFS